MTLHRSAVIALIAGIVSACTFHQIPEPVPESSAYVLEYPAHFPAPDIPADNALTEARVALGKRLFFEPLLSRDSSVSCSSCHLQNHAFADPRPVSEGVYGRKGFRNAPSLANVAWQKNLFLDGGVQTLEKQVLAPMEMHEELDLPMAEALPRLLAHPQYPELFREAYARGPDAFSVVRAIAAFQRTLVSGGSAYDRYLAGDAGALSPMAMEGMALFFSEELKCGACHSGPLLTHFGFEHNGLKDDYRSDPGRMRVTAHPGDEGFFKVPSLRNVSVTAPYMHDGSLATLGEVLDHYAFGGKHHPLKSPLIKGFNLSGSERAALLTFLDALSDYAFLTDPAHRP